MEARRGKGLSARGPAASRRAAALGKENICPALNSRGSLCSSRSPLPEGFPRSPLQDITDILSSVNDIRPNDSGDVAELGRCGRGKKRSKSVAEMQTSSCCTRSQPGPVHLQEWRGLRKCVILQAAKRDTYSEGNSKALEYNGIHSLPNVTDLSDSKDATAKPMDSAGVEEVSMPCSEMIETEQTKPSVRDLKTEVKEASSHTRPLTSLPKSQVKHSKSSLAARSSFRALQEKPKMSNIMKFR